MQQFRFGEAVVVQGLPGTTHASVTEDGKVMITVKLITGNLHALLEVGGFLQVN